MLCLVVFDLFAVCRLASRVLHTCSLQHSCKIKGPLGGHDLLVEVPLLSLPGYPPLLYSVSVGSLPPKKEGHEDNIIRSMVPPKQLKDKETILYDHLHTNLRLFLTPL